MTVIEATTRTIKAPGATLTYDVRGGSTDAPPLFLIGSPMGAAGFATLASHFPDRTIITYDPRGAERSTKDDPSSESNPDQHADDLHRIIQEVGGPVDLFASSGGAVNALGTTHYQPDFDALRAASTRIVIAAGAESEGEMANRGGHAVADRLGTEPVIFLEES